MGMVKMDRVFLPSEYIASIYRRGGKKHTTKEIWAYLYFSLPKGEDIFQMCLEVLLWNECVCVKKEEFRRYTIFAFKAQSPSSSLGAEDFG